MKFSTGLSFKTWLIVIALSVFLLFVACVAHLSHEASKTQREPKQLKRCF